MLTIFMHIPIEQAIAASIVSVIAVSSGAGSVYVKDRITNVRIAMFLEGFHGRRSAASARGILPATSTPALLYILFGVLLLVSLIPIFGSLARNFRRTFKTIVWHQRFV